STLLGDFNGDGFTDIANFNKSSQILTVALSTGDTSDRFAATSYQTSIGPPGTCTAADDILYTGNYNGDSHTDLICRNQNTGALKLALGFGNGQMRPQTVSSGAWCAAYYDFGTADFNGDGRSDLYCTPRAYTAGTVYTARNVDVNGASQAGLLGLRTISNGIGGSSTIVYRSSSDIANTYLPIGMVSQVVAQTTNNDGRGNVATINYSYSGGLFSNLERRFLGFRRVTSTYDAGGNYNETYYFQRAGSSSKPETSYRRSPSGAIWHYNHHVYCEDGKRSDNNAACGVGDTAAPFTSVLIERWEYQCNLSSSCRRTLQQFGYDSYANATAVYEHGDYDVAGDERTTVRGFTPNPGAYIVASPAYENVYRGIGTAGTLVQQTFFHYDNATAHTTAPVRGDLTEKRHLKDNGTFATTRYAYDAKGNLTRSTNPLNQSTTIAYDATYGVYDVRSTDALGRASTKTWDYVRGQISSQTDVNASPVSYTHDAFGRPVQRTNPDGGTVRYSYLNWGSPTTQRIVETAADGSADGLWTETYFDGMNRPWMTVREKAPSARIQITNYDGASDRIKSRSLWHFAGSTPLYVQYAYDGTGRETSVRYPDGVQVRSIYAPGRVDRYDENNNRKASFFDGLGRLTRVDEYNGAAVSTSRYEYDVRNNLTRFVDAAGRATTSTWDRLGRKLQFCEPSSGCSAYTYDDAGQM
ncbi:MAG: toxin TcdB middle/N-terminal domain-containing protein, partial [Sphingorhabdus sp.]|uniref:toxin TcdB middle/N-terminal domain-containing protein n=1 Tax=Sphingorhabdus sp. TaxID=1902408 RepID=UPI003C93E362